MPDAYRGKCLIAGKRLRDLNFFKTVVLVVEHGSEGAMGLVVNRPSSVSVAHALSEHFNLPETNDLVYLGGPVEPSNLFILHNAADVDENEEPVVPGLYAGSSPEIFETIVRSAAANDHTLQFRIFSGCAGWAPGQLEGEIARGDWYVHPAVAGLVFHENPYEVWDETLRMFHESNRTLPQPPEDPQWN